MSSERLHATGSVRPRTGFRRRARLLLVVGVGGLTLAATGCGSSSSSGGSSGGGQTAVNPNGKEVSPAGDIPDNQAYVAYAPPGGGYAVRVPEGWSRTTSGGTVRFSDKLNAIALAAAPASGPLTVTAARSSELPRLAKANAGFAVGTVSTVSRKGGNAVRITYTAKGPQDPVTGKAGTDAVERYVFFHGGRRVTLTVSGPKGADNVDPWRIVSDSLRWTR